MFPIMLDCSTTNLLIPGRGRGYLDKGAASGTALTFSHTGPEHSLKMAVYGISSRALQNLSHTFGHEQLNFFFFGGDV